jgi:NAD(P)-dependent dehydrogenase (short-subunit alcohol dehydrogenase family)
MVNNKIILIAGSEGSVGMQVAARFKREGWVVIGFDIKDVSQHTSMVDKCYVCDIRDMDQVTKTVHEVEEKFGNIQALFMAAGIHVTGSFESASMEEWNNLLNTVLAGTANLSQAIVPSMVTRKEGKVILLSPDYRWVSGEHILEATAAGTLHGFAKSFGVEMAPNNVLVNALSPNIPFDLERIASVVFFLAEKDHYTTAQVVSINGIEEAV